MAGFDDGSNKKKLIIGIAAGAVLLAAVAAALFFFVFSTSAKARKQLKIADGYYANENYEEAVNAYKKAIEYKPASEAAYIGLAKTDRALVDAYLEKNDFDQAKACYQDAILNLENGVKNTNSEEIQKSLDEFNRMHAWKAATCTEPKTCVLCGITDGEALGHEWERATMKMPKTCSRCEATEGDPVSCKEIYAKDIITERWERFVFFDNSVVGFIDKVDSFSIYDYDGKLLKEVTPVQGAYSSWSFSLSLQKKIRYNNIAFMTTYFDKNGKGSIILYDQYGEVVKDFDVNQKFSGYLNNETLNERYLYLKATESKGVEFYIDTKTLSIVNKEDMEPVLEFDTNLYSSCERTEINEDLFFVTSADKKSIGFVDKNFNVIAMYADATNFNSNGFALVSKDGKSYDIIDSDFNVIAESYVLADDVWWSGGPVMAAKKGNAAHYYLIK